MMTTFEKKLKELKDNDSSMLLISTTLGFQCIPLTKNEAENLKTTLRIIRHEQNNNNRTK